MRNLLQTTSSRQAKLKARVFLASVRTARRQRHLLLRIAFIVRLAIVFAGVTFSGDWYEIKYRRLWLAFVLALASAAMLRLRLQFPIVRMVEIHGAALLNRLQANAIFERAHLLKLDLPQEEAYRCSYSRACGCRARQRCSRVFGAAHGCTNPPPPSSCLVPGPVRVSFLCSGQRRVCRSSFATAVRRDSRDQSTYKTLNLTRKQSQPSLTHNARSPRFAIVAIINFDVFVTRDRRISNGSFKTDARTRRFHYLVILDDTTRDAKVENVNLEMRSLATKNNWSPLTVCCFGSRPTAKLAGLRSKNFEHISKSI